ncbi:cyclin-dependent kinase-like 2 [Plakobranchus ocellatus]|uniref:Cyclin-dependent kinase-like 2 n=2 Tax=Plakobranchus ocellatus TaxID=259542 RepID=A0AAV4BER5_9GAST|nr:cyclin-dependent kinase-like 2 [Plakobranchus ocellatus]
MRNLENHPGIKVGGQNINNLRYADDTVLIAENKEDLQKLLNIVEEESRKKGLELNSKKTEVMVISRKQESPKCDIFINKVKLKQTEKFNYLGTIISNDGKTNREISARTAQAKINFQKMKTILTNKHISIETRKRALQCYIEPVLMYGCEAWPISKQIQNKQKATEMWFLRRMLRISWTAKKTNERGGLGPSTSSTGTVGGGGAGAGASTTGASGARGMERYENLGLVGEGSYGMVLKCRHKDTGQLVAIKKFLESEDDKMVKKIAMREVKMLKQLQHDNLVNLIETFRRRKRLYLVFEFVDHTVLDELEKCPNGLDENTARKILWQVLKGTEFCHFHNIIHRDIKPENILVSKSGIVKICDFGFARTLAQPGEAYTDYVATRWYRAPELLVGDTKYGRAVDIWAVGCLLSEMLTGEPLFPGDSDIDQLYHIIRCFGNLTPRHKEVFHRNPLFVGMRLPEVRDIVPLEKKFTRVSTESLALMKQCLQLDPDKRPTCSELLKHNLFQRDGFGARFAIELKQKLHQENVSNPLLKNRSSGTGRTGSDAVGKGGATEDSNENYTLNQQANNSNSNSNNNDSGKGGGGGTLKKKKKVEEGKNGNDDKSNAKRKIIESENSSSNNLKTGSQANPSQKGPSPAKPKSTTPLGSHSFNTHSSVVLPPAGGLVSHVTSHTNSPDAGGPLSDRGDNRDRDKGESVNGGGGGGGGRSSSREFPASPQQMVTTSIPPINNSLNLQGSPAMARQAPTETSWSPRHPPLLNGNRLSSFRVTDEDQAVKDKELLRRFDK